MTYRLSAFGERFDDSLGTLSLMNDLGDATENPDTVMLGGGNPARIPAVEAHFAGELNRLAGTPSVFADSPCTCLCFFRTSTSVCCRSSRSPHVPV
ncbi:MAG: hypothetical protein AAF460_15990, partial [Pseudomonadota bacterium]